MNHVPDARKQLKTARWELRVKPTGVTMGRPIEEQPRQQQCHHDAGRPQPVAPGEGAKAGRGDDGALGRVGAHVSRVPISPRGLNTRISTSRM